MKKPPPLLMIVAIFVLVLPIKRAEAAFCGVADPVWLAGHQSAEAVITGRVALMGTNLTRERALTLEALLGAVKVFTKQTSLNSERTIAMNKSSQEASVATMTEQNRREALVAAREQYAFDSGQGVDACNTVALMSDTSEAIGNSKENARRSYSALDIAPGKATPAGDAVRTRLAARDKADAAVLFSKSASAEDRKAVIELLAGLPMPYPDRTTSGAEADLMMLQARRVEALRSPALVSLTAVAAMSSNVGHIPFSAAKPPVEQLNQLVDQYGGGPKFDQWSANLASQSERGLLVELTRLRSMSLRLRHMQTEQQARVTALFATMLATQAGGDL